MNSAYQTENLKSTFVDLASTIRDDTYNNLLPPFRTPCLRFIPATQMRNILDDPDRSMKQGLESIVVVNSRIHCLDEEHFILVIHGHHDE